MRFHLIDIPIDAQKASSKEVSLWCGKPKKYTACKRLRVLCKGREGVNNHAPIRGLDNAGMKGENTKLGILWEL